MWWVLLYRISWDWVLPNSVKSNWKQKNWGWTNVCGSKKFCCPKILRFEKNLGIEKVLMLEKNVVKNIFGSKYFFFGLKINLRYKKIVVKKVFVSTFIFCVVNNFYAQKKFWHKKNLGLKIIWVPKSFWMEKNLGPKNIWVNKSYWSTNFIWFKKFCSPWFFLLGNNFSL